jgi:predicted nucleic acid-binding protein
MEMARNSLDMTLLIHQMNKDQLRAHSNSFPMILELVRIQHSFKLMVNKCSIEHMVKVLKRKCKSRSLVHMNRVQQMALRSNWSTKLEMVHSTRSCWLMARSKSMK